MPDPWKLGERVTVTSHDLGAERVFTFGAVVTSVAANGSATVEGVRFTKGGRGFGGYSSRSIRRPTKQDEVDSEWRRRADMAKTKLKAFKWSVNGPLDASDEALAKAREAVLGELGL